MPGNRAIRTLIEYFALEAFTTFEERSPFGTFLEIMLEYLQFPVDLSLEEARTNEKVQSAILHELTRRDLPEREIDSMRTKLTNEFKRSAACQKGPYR